MKNIAIVTAATEVYFAAQENTYFPNEIKCKELTGSKVFYVDKKVYPSEISVSLLKANYLSDCPQIS